jgi:hypothetical protein
MPADLPVLREPWRADVDDVDVKHYRIVRGADDRPLAYMDKHLSLNAQNDLAKMITASPRMLVLMREVFFAPSDANGRPEWSYDDWRKWRNKAGPILAELWVNL